MTKTSVDTLMYSSSGCDRILQSEDVLRIRALRNEGVTQFISEESPEKFLTSSEISIHRRFTEKKMSLSEQSERLVSRGD